MSRKYFEEQCEIDLGDNEEDYLFPFFISAQRTMFKKARQNGLTVSVISHTNGSVTHYLMEQLTMFYGNELDLRGPYPVYAKENCTADNPDFLISTVQTKNFSSVFKAPVVTISSLLEQDDRHKVNRCIDRIMCERLYGKLPKDLNDYFRPDLVFSLNNKESLVSTLSVIKEQMTSKNKTGKIRSANPDKDYYTLLKNGLLFIYQIDNNINEPTAAFVSLNKTISWKHLRSVQTIMYVILPETQKRYLGWFYYIAKSLSDSSSPEEMIKNRLI